MLCAVQVNPQQRKIDQQQRKIKSQMDQINGLQEQLSSMQGERQHVQQKLNLDLEVCLGWGRKTTGSRQ